MRSLLVYLGKNFYMLRDILSVFRRSGKKTLIYVFSSSGKLLLNADAEVKANNDINCDIVEFFEELKRNRGGITRRLNSY